MAVPNKKPVLKNTLRLVATNYFAHRVGENAAALAYYLLFAIFPLLIFLSNLLGLLELNVSSLTQTLQEFLPRDIVELVETYLDHVSGSSSRVLLGFSLVFSIWFPMRAVQGLMRDVRRAYGEARPQHPIAYTLRQLAYTVVFLVVIMLTLLLTTMGKRVIEYIDTLLPAGTLSISDYLLSIWQYLRFFLMALLMSLGIGALYAISLDKRQPIKTLLPGIFTALFSWLAVSIGFSFYTENFNNFSVIYGTLGAVILLLTWLYVSAAILILGAELNAALQTVRHQPEEALEKP